MKHALIILALVYTINSQGFRLNFGTVTSSLIKADEKDGKINLSLANFMKDETALEIAIKYFVNKNYALGLKHFSTKHNVAGSDLNLPAGSTVFMNSWEPTFTVGHFSENGTFTYVYLGFVFSSYQANGYDNERPNLLSNTNNILIGLAVDFPFAFESAYGFTLDLSYQIGTTKIGSYFKKSVFKDLRVKSNVFRLGISLYLSFVKSTN